MADIKGEHWIIEFYDCPAGILDDPDALRRGLTDTCEQGGFNLLQMVEHQFSPQGVTMLGLLSESHISIHTWPEEGYAAIDIFTCGDKSDMDRALEVLKTTLTPGRFETKVIRRGNGI